MPVIRFYVATVLVAAALGSSCSSSSKNDKGGGTVVTSFQSSRIDNTALAMASLALGEPDDLSLASTYRIGQSEGKELESLSYRLQRIEFCGKLQHAGNGHKLQRRRRLEHLF